MTTVLSPLSPVPPFLNRRGQMPRLASPLINCESCGQPLIEVSLNSHYCFLCDNWHCPLFRHPQDYRARHPVSKEVLPERKPDFNKTLRTSYQMSLDERKEIYREISTKERTQQGEF